jgi:hypothetical protein
VLAFHYCGDASFLASAKSAVEFVVPAIRRLSRADWEFSGTYTLEHLLSLSWVHTVPVPSHMSLGLFLVRNFKGKILSGWTMNDRQTQVATFQISPEIVAVKDAGRTWDDHIRAGIEKIEASMRTFKSEEPTSIKPTSRATVNEPLIFVSCGQSTPAERQLGQEVTRLVEGETGCKTYFAENQTTTHLINIPFQRSFDTANNYGFSILLWTRDTTMLCRYSALKTEQKALLGREARGPGDVTLLTRSWLRFNETLTESRIGG